MMVPTAPANTTDPIRRFSSELRSAGGSVMVSWNEHILVLRTHARAARSAFCWRASPYESANRAQFAPVGSGPGWIMPIMAANGASCFGLPAEVLYMQPESQLRCLRLKGLPARTTRRERGLARGAGGG